MRAALRRATGAYRLPHGGSLTAVISLERLPPVEPPRYDAHRETTMATETTADQIAQRDDVRELIRSIHEDRLAAKAKEQRESWTRYVSLMIVLLAVATAIGSLKAGGFGSRVMMSQAQASDTWAFYQAKSIKRRIAEVEAHGGTGEVAARAAADVARYASEENDVQRKAQALEAARDVAARHGPPLGFAIASLQISIALASVCLITKRKPLWAASGVLGTIGIGYLVYGLYFV
jgi:Domain of unknown function (DUF4337)